MEGERSMPGHVQAGNQFPLAGQSIGQIIGLLPSEWRRRLMIALRRYPSRARFFPEEIRFRTGFPPTFVVAGREVSVSASMGAVGPEDLQQILQALCGGSVYSVDQQLREGFLTLPGGHRLGVCGHAVIERGQVKAIQPVSSLNLRLAREVHGAADSVLPQITNEGRVYSTLVLSPPACGKTTLLRDIARQLSSGTVPGLNGGLRVAIADERGEIAGIWRGHRSFDLGPQADVLDGCPKALAMMMLIRSMSPQVLVADEIGGEADVRALLAAGRGGVAVITSAHATDVKEAQARSDISALFRHRLFQRCVVLSRRCGPGSIEEVMNPLRLS